MGLGRQCSACRLHVTLESICFRGLLAAQTIGMATKPTTVYLVGAGPGDPDLLTLKAHRILREADEILHDDLVPAAILALANPVAVVANVGKRCGAKTMTQEQINARMIQSAREGRKVARLKGGDPGIFGRMAEEIDALEAAGVPFEVIPGITAGMAAAASLGISLTDRRKSSHAIFVSAHPATTTMGRTSGRTGRARPFGQRSSDLYAREESCAPARRTDCRGDRSSNARRPDLPGEHCRANDSVRHAREPRPRASSSGTLNFACRTIPR